MTVWRVRNRPAKPHRKGKCGQKIRVGSSTHEQLVFIMTENADDHWKTLSEIAQTADVEASVVTL